jgi:alpha-L-fucosidase
MLASALLAAAPAARAQSAQPAETLEQKAARMAWWTEARFGMFIHWGLYAEAARHEWVKRNEPITDQHYQRYFERFDPDLFEPREWAKLAKAAGLILRLPVKRPDVALPVVELFLADEASLP